jgi:DNA adenine methylase
VNKKGEFNVPFGRYTNPKICDEENLRAVSGVLRSATLAVIDFEAVRAAKKGDAVYIDPPYTPLSSTSNFTAYTKSGFGAPDQIRLRDCFKELDARGVHVLLSNSDTPLVRELYKSFRIEEVQAPRRINSKGGKRGNVGELLISGRNAL